MESLDTMVFVPSGKVALEASQSTTQVEIAKIIELYGYDAGEFIEKSVISETDKSMIDLMMKSVL